MRFVAILAVALVCLTGCGEDEQAKQIDSALENISWSRTISNGSANVSLRARSPFEIWKWNSTNETSTLTRFRSWSGTSRCWNPNSMDWLRE